MRRNLARRSDEMNASWFRIIEQMAGAVTVLVAAVVWMSWALESPALKSVLPGMSEMRPATALCFLLAGAALWILVAMGTSTRAKAVAGGSSVLVLLIGCWALVEYLFGADFGPGSVLPGTTIPGRMAPSASIAFVLLSTALIAMHGGWNRASVAAAGFLGALVALMGLFSLLGWAGVASFGYGWIGLKSMALPTGALFVVLGSGCAIHVWRGAGPPLAIGRRLLAGFALGLAIFAVLSMVSYESERRLAEMTDRVRHTHEVLAKLHEVNADLIGVQTGVRGFVITGQTDFLAPYLESLQKLHGDELLLRRLTADNPRQQERLTTLEEVIRQRLALSEKTLEVRRQRGPVAAAELIAIGTGQNLMKRFASVIGEMQQEERDLLTSREAGVRAQAAKTHFILPLGTFIGLMLILTVMFFVNSEAYERREAEAASRISAEIVASTSDAVITETLLGIITSWNPGAERIFGYTAREAVGRSVAMLIPSESAEAENEMLNKIGRGDRMEPFETVRLRKDGRLANVSLSVSPLKDTTGQIIGAAKILRDITEQKQSQEALRASEGRYRALFENAPDGILIADARSTYLDANASICRMLGYGYEELIGMHATNIVAPAEFERIEPALQAIKDSSNYHREWRFRRKDGSDFSGEVIAATMPDGNLVAIIRDITERKNAERALRDKDLRIHAADRRLADIVNGMTEACFALDADWCFSFINDRGVSLLHCERARTIGHSIWEVFAQLAGSPMEAIFRRAMTERVPGAFETFSITAGRWLDVRLFPTGEGLAAFLLDIDARKRAEESMALSETRYRRLFETANDGILILDAETGMVVDVNPFLVSMLGYSRESFLGKAIWELGFFQNVVANRDNFAELTSREYVRYEDLPLETVDGHRIEVEFISTVYLVNEDKVMQCNIRDVSARVRAEASMRESEARYRTLFEYAPDGIVIGDSTGRYLDANAAMCRMMGYTREELLDRHPSDIVAPVVTSSIDPAFGNGKTGNDSYREWQFQRKDGSRFVAEVVAAQMPGGNPMGMIRDVTERKQTERRLGMRNAVSRVLADAMSLAEATPGIIRAICDAELWDFGSIWEADGASNVLRCHAVWHRPEFQGQDMAARTLGLTCAFGQGLPGRVWADGEMRFIPDVTLDAGYLRAEIAAAAGLRGALAFPVFAGTEVTGVIDFAAREIRPPDPQLMETFLAIGRQVGQFMERQHAEKALREGEERFRTMANSIPQLAWIARADGFIHWYNERWYQYTGTTADQMEGWGWQIVHDPQVLPKVVANWTGSIASGLPLEMEFPLRGADGKFRTFLTRVQPLKDSDGRVVQWFGTNTDVEELKRMEGSLRTAQSRLHSTLAAGSIGTWTWDIVNDRLTADEFTARKFSIDPDTAAIGLPAEAYLRAVVEEDQPGVAAGLAQAIQSCGHYDIEYRVRQEGGQLCWLQAKGRVEGDAAGNAVHFHGAVMDITARKQTEARFRRFVDSNAQGVIFWNINGDITAANDAFLGIVGHTREDLEAGRISWAAMTPPEYAELDRRSLEELAVKGMCAPFEKEYIRKDGSRVPILLGAAMFEDSPDEGVCFVLDITERKRTDKALRESEEHFRFLSVLSEATRTLVDPARIMAVTARMLGEHLHVSRCAYAEVEKDGERFTILHDYTDACASTVGSYQLSLFGERAAATLHNARTLIIRDVEAELSPAEGADMFNAIGIKAIITCPLVKDGCLHALMAVHQTTPRDWRPAEIAIVQDVVERCWATIERGAAEESLRRLNTDLERRVSDRTAQLEAANKELEAFSYSVSHDLRAPLRTMDGFSQAVIEDYGQLLPEEGRRYLQTIRDGAQRMGALIDDLLNFARLSRQPLHMRRIDTEKLVRDVLHELASSQPGRAIETHVGDLPVCQGDPALLKQVWINLLSNALKYTRNCERAVLEIGCSRVKDEDVYFVRDNGTGFDMKYAHKLFGVFQRLHRAEDYEGTGVGLAIVQRVIHRHGGNIWAEAAEGRGATFYFTLEGAAK